MSEHKYSIAWLDKAINGFIGFVFYYRLVFVALSMVAVCCYSCHIYNNSPKGDELKNLLFVLTGGSIIIAIFYSILNYENTHRKGKDDVEQTRLNQSFMVACEWHRPTMVANLKITKQLLDKHKHLCDENKPKEFFDVLEADEEARSALVSIFNYLEIMALGIELGILDEAFIRQGFKTMFLHYSTEYDTYILYRRKVNKTPAAWEKFTLLANKWRQQN